MSRPRKHTNPFEQNTMALPRNRANSDSERERRARQHELESLPPEWDWNKEPKELAQPAANADRPFGCLPRDCITRITQTWICSQINCKLSLNGVRGAFEKDNKNIFVLDCGHFLCGRCTRGKDTAPTCGILNCPPLVFRRQRFMPLHAHHTRILRREMYRRGIPCPSCPVPNANGQLVNQHFPHDLMFLCTDDACSDMSQLDGRNCYDLWSTPGIVRFFSGIAEHFNPRSFRLTVLCLWCIVRHIHAHNNSSHRIMRVFDHINLKHTMKTEFHEARDMPARSFRTGATRLSAFNMRTAKVLLEKHLTCYCGKVYSSLNPNQHPVVRNCGHVMCNDCKDLTNECHWSGRVAYFPCRLCPGTNDLLRTTVQNDRRIADLQFSSFRRGAAVVQCNTAGHRNTHFEGHFITQDVTALLSNRRNPQNFCLDCIVKAQMATFPAADRDPLPDSIVPR